MRTPKFLILGIIIYLLSAFLQGSDIVEKIYAVVNNEIITYSELRNSELELTKMLSQQYSGKELTDKIEEMKKNLLNTIIDQKIILSLAKEKNYDVTNDVEMIIKDIKKQYNLQTDDDLKSAIESQGLNYNEWSKQLKETRIQHRLIYEEIGSKISIGNAEIMEYYKANVDKYTKPMEISLNCIYLDKAQHITSSELLSKKKTIDSEILEGDFIAVAKKYSQLPSQDNNYFLGTYKTGELDKKLESVATELSDKQVSEWIETDTGWYRIQLIDKKDPEVIEYKNVRSKIENLLRSNEEQARLKVYLEKIKKESYVKIYHQYQ